MRKEGGNARGELFSDFSSTTCVRIPRGVCTYICIRAVIAVCARFAIKISGRARARAVNRGRAAKAAVAAATRVLWWRYARRL